MSDFRTVKKTVQCALKINSGLKSLIQGREEVAASSISRLPFYSQITFCFITLEGKKDTKIKFQKLIELDFFYKILHF